MNYTENILADFITPWKYPLKSFYRNGTSDYNTLLSCINEDEYRMKDLNLQGWAIDLGAHIGAATLSLLAKGCSVISVEPIPENVEMMALNLNENSLSDKCKILQKALASKSDLIESLYYTGTDTSTGIIHEFIGTTIPRKIQDPEAVVSDGREIKVETISLPDIFIRNNIEHCSFLKMDCEGAEWKTFETIPEKYLDMIDYIVGEIHSINGKIISRSDFMPLLKGKFEDKSELYFPLYCHPGKLVHIFFERKK